MKCGALRWKSAQIPNGLKNKETKPESITTGKMKIRLLKDEPLPVERVPEPPPKDGRGRKSKLKGKVCGQCEARTAGLVCAECGEDYCVGCFARFHQKGALKFHHMIPVQAELHTSISSVDVRNRFQKNEEKEAEEERSDRSKHSADEKHATQVLLVNDGDVMEDEEGEEPEESLLRGQFDEEESSRSFQQALMQWRNSHAEKKCHQSDSMVQTPRPVSVEVTGTQSEERPPAIRIEFRDHGLSYMEKLLLKKHRRTPIESYRLLSTSSSPQDQNVHPSKQPNEENHQLTAEELDLHSYCVSLFSVSTSAGPEEPNYVPKSHPSITEIDETAADSAAEASSGVTQRDDDEKTFNQARKGASAPPRVEELGEQTTSMNLSGRTFTNEAMLNQFLQSPPSNQRPSSLTSQNLKQSEDTLVTASSPRLGDFLKSQTSQGSQEKSMFESVQDWDFSLSASFQSQSLMHSTPVLCRSPVLPVSSSPTPLGHLHTGSKALDPSLSVASLLQDEVYCTTKHLDSSQDNHTVDNEAVLHQVSLSSRLDDLTQSQTSRSSPNATSTPNYLSLTSGDSPHLHSPSLRSQNPLHSTSVQFQSPEFPVFSEPNMSTTPSKHHHKGYKALDLPVSVPSTPKEIPESHSPLLPTSILCQSPTFLDSSGPAPVDPALSVPSHTEETFGGPTKSLDSSLCPTPANEVTSRQVSPSPRLDTFSKLQTPTQDSDSFPAPSSYSQAKSSLIFSSPQRHPPLFPVSTVAELPEQHHISYKALEMPSSLQSKEEQDDWLILDVSQKSRTPANEGMLSQVSPSPRLSDLFEPLTQRTSAQSRSRSVIEQTRTTQDSQNISPSPRPYSLSTSTSAFPVSPLELKSRGFKDLNPQSTILRSTPYTSSSEPQKCPASAEELSSEDEEPKEQINLSGSHIAPHPSSPDSDMSSESMGLMPSDNEGSSDEDMRSATVQAVEPVQRRSISSSQRSFSEDSLLSQSCRSTENSGLFTEPSTTLRSLAQRHSSVSSHYQGLNGFLNLGVDTVSNPLNPALSYTPEETLTHPIHSESFITGKASWRPDSSLRHHIEAELVNEVINNQPISISLHSATPTRKTVQPGSPNVSDVSRPPTAPCSLSVSRPASLKVRTVEMVDPALSDQDDEEEDELALMSLEEELRRMSAKPGQLNSYRHKAVRRWEEDDSDF
ncbi:zinc finger B-box domain-containing protein 1 isoform X2 [Trichomycterus rosablanca]|uniref:zinc finger B-box domain-containing protein 1 isoform X2 n=1 Tax=Trichomycterus rosablanca TaxID=2290929 RepID=UPI002F34FD06